MNIETLIENIKSAKSFSVDMCKNTITLDSVVFSIPNVQFNCNWSEQKIVEIIGFKRLNASCNNISMKDENKKSISLPIYESLLLKSDIHNIMSLSYYRIAKDGEI